ncbi:cytidylate kinase family protein [Desulfovibrio sp. Fe33]|uniref:cytidylate kinase family protein n=1 Tax=Desulfovibrio sp. Fe33 TaxID=3020842 RepID=UPI00234E1380|nr:cytidylate kinase family protein [Desulfovibrio sp. Fe33]
MIAITLFNGLYCNAHQVVERIMHTTGYRLVTDGDVVAEAAKLSGMDEERLAGVFPMGVSSARGLGPDYGEAVGWLRLAMAQMLSERRDLIFHGYSSLLLPPGLRHVLRVCLVSEMRERMLEGSRVGECPEQELRSHIFADDQARAEWVIAHTDYNDPWDRRLYDLVLPVPSLGIKQSACRIVEQLCNAAVQHPGSCRESLDDFLLSARARVKLTRWGNCVSVSAKRKALTLCLTDHRKALEMMVDDLRGLVSGIEGVKHVYAGTSRAYSEVDVHHRPVRRPSSRNDVGSAFDGERFDSFPCEPSGKREDDAALAGKVQAVLSQEGYPVSVYVDNGSVSLSLLNHAAMLQIVARKLCDLVSGVDGVESVDVGVAQTYHQTSAYLRLRRDMASRILRADDREFVPFTSERLRKRDSLSIAVYDGETPLEAETERKSEVVLLDTDLPGLDEAEAVRRVRRANPGAKVLVLLGIGLGRDLVGDQDMDVSAYLRKPVTAAVLGAAIRGATADIPCTTS